MNAKKFSEATDKEIWSELKAAEYGRGFEREERRSDWDLLMSAVYGERWCCRLAARFKRVTTKEGVTMRVFFCPRCGREL